MKQTVYNFTLNLDWKLLNAISAIDRFDATWASIEAKEGQSLKQLKNIATIRSVGASTRIEGSNMSDNEVESLLNNLDITKVEDRDSQEVVGYFWVHDTISELFPEIDISESTIQGLHNQMLKLCEKDDWHRGSYKIHENTVQAKFADGTTQIIFRTTPPGFATDDAMAALIRWYKEKDDVHPLVRAAAFSYDFVSIHPFQDGNGRLSRLLITLLMLKAGYSWIQYVSLEHEIESRKKEYYRVLRHCQANRPNEDITEWVYFLFQSLSNIQDRLGEKLDLYGVDRKLSPLEKAIITCIKNNPGIRSGQIAETVEAPLPTVKRYLTHLTNLHLILRFGQGAGTNYTSG